MNLKPQTVYIPHYPVSEKVEYHLYDEILKGWTGGLKKKENQICLSKEELVELLGNHTEHVISILAKDLNVYGSSDDEMFINNLLNQ